MRDGPRRLNDADFMRRAIALSRAMEQPGSGPFGAVIVKDGRIVGEGCNRVVASKDPTAHAEIVAIRAACALLDDFSLRGGAIYSSCEPCPMCLAAIYWARIERVYYGNDRGDAARIGFDDDAIYREIALPLEARLLPMTRLLAGEARQAFDAWQRKPDKIPY
jgi:tRNA(Arg) A34 adenosine deaminase TadA